MGPEVRQSSFDDQRSTTIRHRARIAALMFCAIWIPMSVVVDPQMFESTWAGLWLRGPTAALLLGLWWFLRRPRPRRDVELAVTTVFSIVMAAFGPAVVVGTLDNALPNALSITVGAMAISTAVVLSWKSAAVLCAIANTALLAAGLIRDPRPGIEYFFVVGTAFVMYPLVVFAAGSRDRWQRSEIAAREQLQQAHEQLRREERMRSQLFINLSHDFRTPLSVITSEVELLRDEQDDLRWRGSLERIDANAQVIVDLIDQLLQLARMDAGKAPCAPSSYDVLQCAREIAGQLQPARSSAVVVRADSPQVIAHVDPAHLRRILTNLIANSLRHVDPESGHVEVHATANADGTTRVEVADDGPGISPEQQQTLFERFASFRPEGSMAAGIGLALARELARLNGGELEHVAAASSTTFRLTLKAGIAAAIDDGSQPARRAPLRPEPARAASARGRSDRPRVLIVEDNDHLRDSMTRLLSKTFDVAEASSLGAALTMLDGCVPAAIVADIMLPDGSGYKLLELVARRRRSERVPVVLVSALGEASERTRGISAGADDYLAKPFQGDELRARVTSAIERASAHREALEAQRKLFLMELHDGVKGSLARAAMLLSSSDAERGRALDAIQDALAETQDMLSLFDATAVPWEEVVAELRYELGRAGATGGLTVDLVTTGTASWVAPAARHALQRVLREAMTNAIRHARATRAWCTLEANDRIALLRVEDDGCGLAGKAPGRGLEIIRSRAEQLGGTARFGGRDAGGAFVEVRIPVSHAAAEPRSRERTLSAPDRGAIAVLGG